MLNYKHLFYFREVAVSGSIARASERLHITPQTISEQLSQLEESLGTPLFKRGGRNLLLTEAGQLALKYANEIFQLGVALEDSLLHFPDSSRRILRVGVTDVVPKSIAYRLLEPAMQLTQPRVHIVCTEGNLQDLLGDLAIHRLELVIADSPMPTSMNVKGFNHELGSSGVSFFATTELVVQLSGAFPACLNRAPLLIPSEGNAIRHQLRQWFHELNVTPLIVGEFDDSALMLAFGQAGTGVFIAPSVLEESLLQAGNIRLLGRAENVTERFYAISIERKISHVAVKAITDNAQAFLQQKESIR